MVAVSSRIHITMVYSVLPNSIQFLFLSLFFSKVEVMCSNVWSCVNAMHDQVVRFAERWSQLKPKDEVMEADSCVCDTSLATVKDRKAELQQLMTEWEKRR